MSMTYKYAMRTNTQKHNAAPKPKGPRNGGKRYKKSPVSKGKPGFLNGTEKNYFFTWHSPQATGPFFFST